MQERQNGNLGSLLVPAAAFRPTALELGDGAPAPGAKQQHRPPVGRRHLPQLRPQALVIGVRLAPALPRQAVDLLRCRFQAIFGLQLQIELPRLLQALALRIIAFPRRPVFTADLEGDKNDREGDEEP